MNVKVEPAMEVSVSGQVLTDASSIALPPAAATVSKSSNAEAAGGRQPVLLETGIASRTIGGLHGRRLKPGDGQVPPTVTASHGGPAAKLKAGGTPVLLDSLRRHRRQASGRPDLLLSDRRRPDEAEGG